MAETSAGSSSSSSLKIRQRIIANSIDDDQAIVAEQWAKTIQYATEETEIGTKIAQLLLAGIACGNFRTRSALAGQSELKAPHPALTITDYLSHASRIVIDYKNLSEENQKALQTFFPLPADSNGRVFARSATHAVERHEEGLKELKGMMIGIQDMLPGFLRTPVNYGTEITIGGEGQTNFVNRVISANGFSGHLYFHHQPEEQILMSGIEQSAPQSNLGFFSSASTQDQDGEDQYGQHHSLMGASDTYTAPGSLYFSDPLYQAKLLAEKNATPPDKYDGMHLEITDENWPQIIRFFNLLSESKENPEQLMGLLSAKPSTSMDHEPTRDLNFLSLDFNVYFKRLNVLLQETEQQAPVKELHALEQAILELKRAEPKNAEKSFEALKARISELCEASSYPEAYKKGIQRIEILASQYNQCDLEIIQYKERALICAHAQVLFNRCQQAGQLANSLIVLQKTNPNVLDDKESDGPLSDCHRKLLAIMTRILPPKGERNLNYETLQIHDDLIDHALTFEDILELENEFTIFRNHLQTFTRLVPERNLEELMILNRELVSTSAERQQKIEELESEISRLRERNIPALKGRLERLTDEKDRLQNRHDALEAQNKDYQREQAEFISENQNLQNQVSAANRDLKNERERSERTQKHMQVLAPLYTSLRAIKVKADELEKRGETKASGSAMTLYRSLKQEIRDHLLGDNQDVEQFKNNAKKHIDNARPILDQHRGFKKIIGNLLACIGLLGIGFVIAGSINYAKTRHFTFFNETNSSEKVKKIADDIDEIKEQSFKSKSKPV